MSPSNKMGKQTGYCGGCYTHITHYIIFIIAMKLQDTNTSVVKERLRNYFQLPSKAWQRSRTQLCETQVAAAHRV